MKNTAKDIKMDWHLIDAKDKILGRIATEASMILMGKNKSSYIPYLDTGDYVVVVNAQKIKLSGKKEKQKIYYRHSGYPGGLYKRTAQDQRKQNSESLMRNAVRGMLPKTKLGKIMLKKLYIYGGEEHPYKSKFQTASS